jgi:hypothetical protein
MKTNILTIILLLSFFSGISQEKNLIYTNPDYLFSVTHSSEFENPNEESVGEIKIFRFLDLNIDITIQNSMPLEDAKNSISILKPNTRLKVRSKTYNENKYVAMIENETGKLLKMVQILINEKYTYFININKPIDFEQGINQLKIINLMNY